MADPNRLLRAARERTPSRRVPGAYMCREELAEAVALWATEHDRKHRGVAFDANHLGKLERGIVRCPRQVYVDALCAVLGATPAELGFDAVAVATRPLRAMPRLPRWARRRAGRSRRPGSGAVRSPVSPPGPDHHP